MLNLLLDAAYLIFLLAASPWIIYRRVVQKKPIAGFFTKLTGRVQRRFPDQPCLWFHAVSVGEVLQLRAVITRMQASYPRHEIVITTTTGTGFEVASAKYPDCTIQYFPLDFTWAVRRALTVLRPDLVVLVELELWPNFLCQARKLEIPVAIINGRISDQSFQSYRRIRWLTARLLPLCSVITVQNSQYAERFLDLGAVPARLFPIGNVKFDGVETLRENPQTEALRRIFGLLPQETVLLAGSTQSPEEELAIQAWERLRADFPSLRLLLVPRHQERFSEVADLVLSRGHRLMRRSDPRIDEGRNHERRPARQESPQVAGDFSTPPVLLLDTLGELSHAWGLADIAFVGGSLTNRGGQNMIEPAGYGAAVLFGPNTWNFRDVTAALLQREAARVVHQGDEFEPCVRDLLMNPALRQRLGETAREFVLSQQGATARTISLLDRLLTGPSFTPAVLSKAA